MAYQIYNLVSACYPTYCFNLLCSSLTALLASSPTFHAVRAILIAISFLLEQFLSRNPHSCLPHLMIRFLLTIKRTSLSTPSNKASPFS